MRILFDSKLSQFKTPFGTLRPGEDCRLRVDIPVSCRTVRAEVRFLQDDGVTEAFCAPLRKTEGNALYEAWSGEVSLKTAGLYFYYFFITTQNEAFRLMKQGNDTNIEAGDLWQVSCVEERYPAPEYAKGAVMYQIFPDRFYQAGSCDCAEKLQPYWVHEDKHDMPVYLPDANGKVWNNDFYGGNLNGIREKLSYLQELGVELLYLNPIFFAFSTHRYDTCDYGRIDPMLGTEDDFRALCEDAHARGMKVILDGVFSHVGSRSRYFQEAISDPNSKYRDWFDFKHYPDTYTSWWGITDLPCVRKDNEDFLRYIIDGEDAIAVHWLRAGADGWRLDVVDELPDSFVMRLRNRIRAEKPDALLIGEVWEDASNKIAYGVRRRYFVDRELDSVMNYPWQKEILRFVRGEADGSDLGERIMTLAENYPAYVLACVMNILSTHDTPRAINALLDPRDGDRAELAKRQFSQEDLARGKELLRMAAFLQFTLPGIACIYYGDEAGMTGYRDPFNRRFYPWGEEDESLAAFYRMLSKLKRTLPALKTGDVTVLEAGNGRLMFLRRTKEQTLCVCCNKSRKPWELNVPGEVLMGGGIASLLPGKVRLGEGGYCLVTREGRKML